MLWMKELSKQYDERLLRVFSSMYFAIIKYLFVIAKMDDGTDPVRALVACHPACESLAVAVGTRVGFFDPRWV